MFAEIDEYPNLSKEQKKVSSLIQGTNPGMCSLDISEEEKPEGQEPEGLNKCIRKSMSCQLPQDQSGAWNNR